MYFTVRNGRPWELLSMKLWSERCKRIIKQEKKLLLKQHDDKFYILQNNITCHKYINKKKLYTVLRN